MKRVFVIPTVLLVLGTACSSSVSMRPTNPTPTPNDISVVSFDARTLAEGKQDELATGPTYVSYIDVSQPAGDHITHAHVAGFMYVLSGVHWVTLGDGTSTDLNPGAALYQGRCSSTVVHVRRPIDEPPACRRLTTP